MHFANTLHLGFLISRFCFSPMWTDNQTMQRRTDGRRFGAFAMPLPVSVGAGYHGRSFLAFSGALQSLVQSH